jgi:hypothetical protein
MDGLPTYEVDHLWEPLALEVAYSLAGGSRVDGGKCKQHDTPRGCHGSGRTCSF